MSRPFIYGHRGCIYEPENTLLSIKRAVSLGADGIEIDVMRCKTKEIVVFHDEKVDRITNGKGYVKDFSLKNLKKLDAGKGEKIPTLEEAVEFINSINNKNKKQIKLIIEMKEKNLEEDIVKIIKKYSILDNVAIISFYHKCVKNLKKLNRKIRTGVLLAGNPVNAASLANDANADFLSLNFHYVDADLVKNARKSKLKVFVWNIDDIENLKRMLKLKVDGIGSNKPDVIVGYRNIY